MKKSIVFPEISLDRSAAAPTLRRQIERQLASAIRGDRLPCGSRLPSSRLMAKMLNVSRGTVVDACEALLETGLLVTAAGSGIYVARFSSKIPNFSNLKRTAAAAHYPARVLPFEDSDGIPLYLNVNR